LYGGEGYQGCLTWDSEFGWGVADFGYGKEGFGGGGYRREGGDEWDRGGYRDRWGQFEEDSGRWNVRY